MTPHSDVKTFVCATIAFVLGLGVLMYLLVGPPLPWTKATDQARDEAAQQLVGALREAVESYRAKFGVYPPGDGSGSQGLVKALSQTKAGGDSFFPFSENMLKEGNILNPAVDGILYYQCDAVPSATSNEKRYPFRIWGRDSKGDPTGINSWAGN